MAELFNEVFNPQTIYESLFFSVKSVLKYKTIGELYENDKLGASQWDSLVDTKYRSRYDKDVEPQKIYEENAVYYPMFNQIISISYGILYNEDGKLKRQLKKICNNDEYVVLATFMDELRDITNEGGNVSEQSFPILCGHNIIKHDIPLLLKKYVYYRDRFNNEIPLILKRGLSIKPWESGIIDVTNIWKFNGYDDMSLMMISDYLGLKRTVDLYSDNKFSLKYWDLVDSGGIEEALSFAQLQSSTQANLVIQLMNILRPL